MENVHLAETLEELKIELMILEKQMSRISQHSRMDEAVTECANKIAAVREKIRKAHSG
jgi:ppGpp synthetase/RelA/SpoT-type nucleotidyltranferase